MKQRLKLWHVLVLVVLLSAPLAWGANVMFSALSALTNLTLATGDKVVLLDVSDTTDGAGGTAKTATVQNLLNFSTSWVRQASARNLSSVGTQQAIFDSANDTLTVPTGAYTFSCLLYITAMSATSGNAAFDVLGGGTATMTDIVYNYDALDSTTLSTIGTHQQAFLIVKNTAASMATAGTGTALGADIRGTFEISGAGTIIPSITLVTAATGSVNAGSYCTFRRLGADSDASVGDWG
jgi:hypothetical protein